MGLQKLREEGGLYAIDMPYCKKLIMINEERVFSIITSERPQILTLVTKCSEA